MKTPKEILLERHQAAMPKLDAARQAALASLHRPGFAQAWREFVFSIRWHCAGLGAVWMVILLLRVDSTSGPDMVMAGNKIPPARVLMASLLQNRRELMELTSPPIAAEPAPLPPRRSEIQSNIEAV